MNVIQHLMHAVLLSTPHQRVSCPTHFCLQEARRAALVVGPGGPGSDGSALSWGLGAGGVSPLAPAPSLVSNASVTSLAQASITSNASASSAGGGLSSSQAGAGETLQEKDWLTVLLSKAPAHVKHSFEDEARGMPWARAKFQVSIW